MKLKNLLKHIKDYEYVSIGMDGECVCTCKAEDVPKSIIPMEIGRILTVKG